HLGDPEKALADLHDLNTRIEKRAFDYHGWRWQLRLWDVQGQCYLALNQPHQALAFAEQGMTLAKATTSQKYVATSHALSGMALAQMGKVDQATSRLCSAVTIADQIGYQPLRWQCRWHLANCAMTMNNEDAAK